jgi:hypothetical protein
MRTANKGGFRCGVSRSSYVIGSGFRTTLVDQVNRFLLIRSMALASSAVPWSGFWFGQELYDAYQKPD